MAKPEAGTIKPPDGGWGWMIVACVFFVRFLSFGTLLSIGVAFHLLMEEFNCSKSELGLTATISYSLQCFLGPIVSMLQDRFGTRVVVFCGALVISIAFTLSSFAPNLYFLYFSFGVLGGIGMALVYLPVMVVLSYYFEKRRTLATALGGIGAYAGAFVHPYLMRLIISYYSWRGALFVIGAITLNSLPAAMLLRPLLPSPAKEQPKQLEEGSSDTEKSLTRRDSADHLESFIKENVSGCNKKEPGVEGEKTETAFNTSGKKGEQAKSSPFTRQKSHEDSRQQRRIHSRRNRTVSERCAGDNKFPHKLQRNISASSEGAAASTALRHSTKEMSIFRSSGGIYSPINPDKDIQYAETVLVRTSSQKKTSKEGESGDSFQEKMVEKEEGDEKAATTEQKKEPFCVRFGNYLKALFEIFKNPDYTAFVLSNILICFVYYMPSLFVVDWGKEVGIPVDQTTVMLSFVGLGNICGRPIIALVGDYLSKYRILLFSGMLVLSGVFTSITPLFPNFPFMAFFVFQYAVLTGGSQTMLTPILADMMPLNKLGFAFGILLAAQGAAILVGPPVLVLFPSYAITFTLAGFILIASGLVMFVICYGKRLLITCHRLVTVKSPSSPSSSPQSSSANEQKSLAKTKEEEAIA